MDKNIEKLMKSVELECNLNKLTKRIEFDLMLNEAYMDYIDKNMKINLEILELIENIRHRMTNLMILITAVKDIENQAIVIGDMELMWKCEGKIAKMIDQMELLRDKYDL